MPLSVLMLLLFVHGSHLGNDPTFGLTAGAHSAETEHGVRVWVEIRNTGPRSVILYQPARLNRQILDGDLILQTPAGNRPTFQLLYPISTEIPLLTLQPGQSTRVGFMFHNLPPDEYTLHGVLQVPVGQLGGGCARLQVAIARFYWPGS